MPTNEFDTGYKVLTQQHKEELKKILKLLEEER